MAVLSGAKLDIISLISKFSDDFFAFYRKKPYLRNMKHVYGILWFLAFCLLTGCQKSIDEGTDDNGSSGNGDTGITNEAKANALTIAQAQQTANGTSVCIKGYIVAATERSINNVNFTAPFQGTSAIVLASRKSNGSKEQFSNNEIFPICLTDAAKNIRSYFNLQDNPQYWNQFVYITGTKDDYLSLHGLKKVKAIEIDPSHVVTPDEEPDDDSGTTDPDNPGVDPEDDGPGDEGNTPDPTNPDDTSTDDVLTIAEAITAPEHKTITIQGYVVAAVSGGKNYISFNYPNFDGYRTAIVLADKKFDENTTFDTTGYTDLYIVYLADSSSKIKNELNLPNHPDNQNRLVRITGKVGFYYGTKLLIKVDSYQWVTP